MEFMLDSANLNEIREVKDLGLLDGLTTNPIIIKRGLQETSHTGDFLDYVKKILELTKDKPAFFQVTSQPESEIVADAERLYHKLKGYGNVHIKVPIDTSQTDSNSRYEGIRAIRELSKKEFLRLQQP